MVEECQVDGAVGACGGVFAVFVYWVWLWVARVGEVFGTLMPEDMSPWESFLSLFSCTHTKVFSTSLRRSCRNADLGT